MSPQAARAPGRGCYVAFEGIDAAGKSTQAGLLAHRLDAVLTREPGGTPLGVQLRAVVLDHNADAPLAPRAEVLAFCADRAQHLAAVVVPALNANKHVVSDRAYGSTLAYQGAGRGFDAEELRWLIRWSSQTEHGLIYPDLTVLLDVDPSVVASRRSEQLKLSDRFESEPSGFLEAVAEAYRQLAAEEPDRWLVVDASPSTDEVTAAVNAGVCERLGLVLRDTEALSQPGA